MRSCVCILLSKSSLLLLLAVAPAATTVTGMLLDDVVALAGDIEDSCITGMGTPCWDTYSIHNIVSPHVTLSCDNFPCTISKKPDQITNLVV